MEHWFIRRHDCVSISLPVYQSVTRKTISYLCINQLPVCRAVSKPPRALYEAASLVHLYTPAYQHFHTTQFHPSAQFRQHLGAGFTKYLTTIVRISYHNANAKVTTDLRRTPNIQYILRMAQGFLRYNSSAKS